MKENTKSFSVKKLLSNPSTSPILIFIVVIIIMIVAQDNFLRWSTIYSYINSFTPLILLAMGQAIVILSGGLDMSSGAAMAMMVCAMTAIMDPTKPATGLLALVVAFVMGIGSGVVNGIAVGRFRLPAVIATYATSFMWQGIAKFITPSPGGDATDWFRGFYDVKYWGLDGASQKFPPALILIVAGAVIWMIVKRCKLGRYIYAVGSNYESAFNSGINSSRIQMNAYVLNGIMVFLAAVFYSAQNAAGNASMGDTLTLQVIAAAIVAGISMAGGRGNVHLAIIGALIMSLIGRVIYALNVESSYQTLVNGIIIIVAIALGEILNMSQRKAELKGES